MIEVIKYTTEEAFYKALADDPRLAGTVLNAGEGSTVELTLSYYYSIPAKYAKYLLKEHIKNEIQTT